ncbi:MAG TPA: DUF6682 family protein [bacterium]
MTISGSDLLYDIGGLLLDPAEATWAISQKESAVNEAILAVCLIRPDATATPIEITMSTGSAMQSVPSGNTRLLDIVMNKTGKPVRKISREVMNDALPDWTTETTATSIEHYMFDEETPLIFYVYPVPSTALILNAIVAANPTVFSSSSSSIGIQEIFIPAVIEYSLYRCLAKEGQGQDLAKAASHLSAFYNLLGAKAQSDAVLKQIQDAK